MTAKIINLLKNNQIFINIRKKVNNVLKNNLLVISSIIIFLFLTIIYIELRFVDVFFLDGLMMVPIVDKYFRHILSFKDIVQQWGEHRLIGYSLIYLTNAIVFKLNLKIEAYIFMLVYLLNTIIIYINYKNLFEKQFSKRLKLLIQISYLPIVFFTFSLVHPVGHFMTTQFVVGTLIFIISSIYFNQICLNQEEKYSSLIFMGLITIYVFIFSGAYFGGALFSFLTCLLFYLIVNKKRKLNFKLIITIFYFLIIIAAYLYLTPTNIQGVGEFSDKITWFFGNSIETFKSLIAGLSSTVLDQNTYMERLKNNGILLFANGSILFLLGIWSIVRYIKLKMYKVTYLPLILISYNVGAILTIRLGRVNGGWEWPTNMWYTFHYYFYLIGIFWIINFDIFKTIGQKRKISLSTFYSNKKILIYLIFVGYIFIIQMISNFFQVRRAFSEHHYYEARRQVMLFPDDQSLDLLLWTRNESKKAIKIMKKYHLSVFRKDLSELYKGDLVKLSGWYGDGWIAKSSRLIVRNKNKNKMNLEIRIPNEILNKIYKNSILVTLFIDDRVIKKTLLTNETFKNESTNISLNIPKNKQFILKINLEKSFIPANEKISPDLRELGMIISEIKFE